MLLTVTTDTRPYTVDCDVIVYVYVKCKIVKIEFGFIHILAPTIRYIFNDFPD